MAKQEHVEMEGVVTKLAGGGFFQITVEGLDSFVLAKLSGKMRMNKIRVVLGDKVTVGISPYDTSRGIIIFRHK